MHDFGITVELTCLLIEKRNDLNLNIGQ
jgi:hypothetical protein